MKNIAVGILILIFLSILVQPMVETANVYRERITLGSALTNSCRAAKDRCLEYDSLRDLDAKVDPDRFAEYFADAFEKTMNLEFETINGSTLKFSPNDDKYNEFNVTINFSEDIDFDTEQLVSKVEVKAESNYRFKTKYMKIADSGNQDVDYKLTAERSLLLYVRN